jgi:hypothetical protein
MKKIKNIIILISMAFSLSGCAAVLIGIGVGAGIGAYKYVEGSLSRAYPIAYSRAWDATTSALENLQISTSNSLDEGTEGRIEAVKRDGTKVVVKLEDKGQGVTNIAIRVGTLGDRGAAEIIHDEIASVSGIR